VQNLDLYKSSNRLDLLVTVMQKTVRVKGNFKGGSNRLHKLSESEQVTEESQKVLHFSN
jgi:hypothetical protein